MAPQKDTETLLNIVVRLGRKPQIEPLRARAYESLKDFIYDQEDAAFAEMVKDMRKTRRKDIPPPDTTWFIFFKDVMERVQEDRASGEAHWVLR